MSKKLLKPSREKPKFGKSTLQLFSDIGRYGLIHVYKRRKKIKHITERSVVDHVAPDTDSKHELNQKPKLPKNNIKQLFSDIWRYGLIYVYNKRRKIKRITERSVVDHTAPDEDLRCELSQDPEPAVLWPEPEPELEIPWSEPEPEPAPEPEPEVPWPEPNPHSPQGDSGLAILRNGTWIPVGGIDVATEKANASIQPANVQPEEDSGFFNMDETATTLFEPDMPEISESSDPAYLLDRVRKSGRMLRFTRNISLRELESMANDNAMVPIAKGEKCYRYGLGHGYGDVGEVLTIVMKEGFWESEKNKNDSALNNIFMRASDMDELNGGNNGNGTALAPLIKRRLEKNDENEKLLKFLASEVDYNRNLEREDHGFGADDIKGMTVMMQDKLKCMEVYPQMDVYRERDFSMIDKIMVPEHLWERALNMAQSNKQIARLLYRMDGTGRTAEDFMKDGDKMARRSRINWGRFQPNYGYDSFYVAEQEYFKLVLDTDYENWTRDMMWGYGYTGVSDGYWFHASSLHARSLQRESRDWKIFINPKSTGTDDSEFRDVLEATLQVLQKHQDLGIKFKIPLDLGQEWKGRTIGDESNTPKIVVYLNENVLPLIMAELHSEFMECCPNAGFIGEPGPAFSRQYSNLLFYKKEYWDQRANIANQAGGNLSNKAAVLLSAGFRGTNFYIMSGDYDPLLAEMVH